MAYATFFEIGGHVVESYVESQGQPSRPAINPLMDKAKQKGVPKPLLRKGAKEIKAETGIDVVQISQGLGRAKRATWAFRTAAALALIDGPLPVGDAIAIGLLATYGTYEGVMFVKDVKEGSGF